MLGNVGGLIRNIASTRSSPNDRWRFLPVSISLLDVDCPIHLTLAAAARWWLGRLCDGCASAFLDSWRAGHTFGVVISILFPLFPSGAIYGQATWIYVG